MSDVRSVAANTVVENVLAGKLHEFLPGRSIVRIMAAGSAAGLRVSALIGGESVVQDQEISAANRFPIFPDDIVTEAAGLPGDRLTVSVRNTTAGALTSNITVDVQPM